MKANTFWQNLTLNSSVPGPSRGSSGPVAAGSSRIRGPGARRAQSPRAMSPPEAPRLTATTHPTDPLTTLYWTSDFPGGSDNKVAAYNVGDSGSIPGSGRSPGEGNSNHSSTVALKIPWMEEPGRLQSMGSQRVGHD